MTSVVHHHPTRLRAADRGEMDVLNGTPPRRSVSTTARPRTPLSEPGHRRKRVPSSIIVPSSHYQYYTPPPSLPAFLDHDEDEDKDDRGLLTIHPQHLCFPLTATPTRSQRRRSAVAPHTPNSPARPTLAMSMTIHSPSPRGFIQPPPPAPAARRRSSTTTSTTSSRSVSPPGRPSSRSERLLRDTLARDETMRERAGHHQQSFHASVPPMPPLFASSSTSLSSAQQQRPAGNREYWEDVFDADCSCAPAAGPSSPRRAPRRMTSHMTTSNADSFSTSPPRAKLQRSPHTFAGGDLSSPSSSALLFPENGGMHALEKLLRRKPSTVAEKQRSEGEGEEYSYLDSAAAIPSSSRRRSTDRYARRGENGAQSAFTSPPGSPTLHAKNMKRMSAQHNSSHHQQLPSPPPTPPHTASALSPSHFPPNSPPASSPPPTYASIQPSKEVELPEGLGIYRTHSHTPQKHRRHESASGALFSTLQRTTSHGAYTSASGRRASTTGGAMTTGRVTPRSASVTRAGASSGYYHYPTPRTSPESMGDEDEDEDEDEVSLPPHDEKRRITGPPSSPSFFAFTSSSPAPKSNAGKTTTTTSAEARAPSPSFDAQSASALCRQMEGYVSFSAVAGLGAPPASAVDEDGDDAGKGKESRGRRWLWKW